MHIQIFVAKATRVGDKSNPRQLGTKPWLSFGYKRDKRNVIDREIIFSDLYRGSSTIVLKKKILHAVYQDMLIYFIT